jgi:hypothetical protein
MALRSAWKVVKSAELKKLLGHSKMKEWSVYIIRCRDRSLYTSISTDELITFIELDQNPHSPQRLTPMVLFHFLIL